MLLKSTKLKTIKDNELGNINTMFINGGTKKYNYELNYKEDKEKLIKDIDTIIFNKNVLII